MTTEKTFEKIEDGEKRDGQIQDFVSGHWVKAGPEEVDAVQIFSRLPIVSNPLTSAAGYFSTTLAPPPPTAASTCSTLNPPTGVSLILP